MPTTLNRRQKAAALLLPRRKARERLLSFAQYINPTTDPLLSSYTVGPPHQAMADALERVERGELKRLMVFVHPRIGKSTLISQVFPCWALGRNPRLQIVQAGYAQPITLEHSRAARDLFISPRMRAAFPHVHHRPEREGQVTIPVLRQAAHQWRTYEGGRYFGVGVGGGLTGRGMDIGIIDDPVKNREDAESPTIRDKIWDWYRSTFYTRLEPGGVIILVMTRWHPDDLAGRLLKAQEEGEGDDWFIIKMPAIDAQGRACWPERWPLEVLERIRVAIGDHEFEALYQQEPTLRGGNLFSMDRIVYLPEFDGEDEEGKPRRTFPDTRYVRFWDLASTEKERTKNDPDYTVGALVGVTRGGLTNKIWVKDLVYCQKKAPERNQLIIATAERDGPEVPIGVEQVGGYKDAVDTLRGILRGLRLVKGVPVSNEKVVRAGPMEPVVDAGNFYVLKAPWNRIFDAHFRPFPNGLHDDAVDAVGGAYAMLQKNTQGFVDRYRLGI